MIGAGIEGIVRAEDIDEEHKRKKEGGVKSAFALQFGMTLII